MGTIYFWYILHLFCICQFLSKLGFLVDFKRFYHNLKSINLSTTSLSTNAHNQLKALVSLENLDTLELNECSLSTTQFEKIMRMFKKTDVRF